MPAVADSAPVRVGLDAEFGNKTSTVDEALRAGLEIAIEEINAGGGVLGGRMIELVTRDNRGVPARGIDNLRELAAMPDMVAVFGAKFSPVLLAQLPLAHELKIPLLSPWSAADSIILHEHRPSYSFRLSLRDGWAMPYLLQQAQARGVRKVGLLVPNGAWGRSNLINAESYSAQHPQPRIVSTIVYEWADDSLANEYEDLLAAGAEAIILVGNEPEAAKLVKAMETMGRERWRPVFSHWGAAAGNLPALAGRALFDLDFSIVQTFSFVDVRTPRGQRLAQAAMARLGVTDPALIPSPPGVAHAYDFMHILASAVEAAGGTERERVRSALEQLPPLDGVIRRYAPPFTETRHEALGPEELFLVRWRADGALVPIPATRR